MKKFLVILSFFLFISFSLISANTMANSVFIRNYITNINDFPDYEFILSVQYPYSGDTRLEIVNQSLIPVWDIGGSPLFGSIYALEKNKSLYSWEEEWIRYEHLFNLEDVGAKKVISNLELFRDNERPQVANITNYYEINLNVTKDKPDRTEVLESYDFLPNYIFIMIMWGLPIWLIVIAMIIIAFLVIRKKKKK